MATKKKNESKERIEAAKQSSTLQLLIKTGRLLNERTVTKLATRPGKLSIRPSHTALIPLIGKGGARITELADKLRITKQAVSQMVDELVENGVVTSVADPEDQRARRVVFTERGRRGLTDGLDVLNAIEKELRGAVGEKHVDSLRNSLIAILGELEKE